MCKNIPTEINPKIEVLSLSTSTEELDFSFLPNLRFLKFNSELQEVNLKGFKDNLNLKTMCFKGDLLFERNWMMKMRKHGLIKTNLNS